MRPLKLALGAGAVLNVALAAGWLAWSLTLPRIRWPLRVLPLAFILPVELLIRYVIKPPVLKADAIDISTWAPAPMFRQRMPRADLALIHRGQFKEEGRKAVWVKYYLFVTRDGKISVKAPAYMFLAEGIAEFAQRLGVPLRGDFSERVKGTVDLSKIDAAE
jgi:hypothetical protein